MLSSRECEHSVAPRGALLRALEGEDLEEMVELLHGYGLISADSKESFLSLQCDKARDDGRQLRGRYLLQLVYEKVRSHRFLFYRFLGCLKGGNKVYDILREERATGSVEEAGEVQDTERCLTEDDITELIGVMASVAHLWEDISIALKIPINVQADIRKEGGSSKVQLYKALNYWVLGDCLKPVTTSTLKQALAGPIVGVASIADIIPTIKKPPAHNRPGGDSINTPNILFQSQATKISYSRSNLLEVEVSNASSSMSYQWYKDGYELSDDDYYENTKSSILLVRHRNMASKHIEGKYICQVEGRITSYEIPVEVHYPDRVRHLLDKYNKLEEIPKDCWPPRCATSFVELALINRNSDKVDEYDYSIRGDMDDVLMKKDKIDFNEAFGKHRSGALVLIEGRPGCGKTTLAHKVTRDWSRGEKVLVGAELVFFFSLRLLNMTQKDRDIDELMEQFYCSKSDINNVGQYLLSSQGDKVCFIFDGLDEYHRKNERINTFVEELISGKLPKAMIITFSRPVGTLQLKQSQTKINSQIEILGLKKNQIHSYVDSYFDTNNDMSQSLKEYLDQHINVLHMCYLPVHASMICYLYSHEGDNLPTTETQIYTQFTTSTITRKRMREDKSFKKVKLFNLSETNSLNFHEICKLAFEMTTKSIQVFCRSEDSVQLIDELGSDGPSLGLVTVDCAAKANGYEDFYSFLHLTFQEFLAAYFIFQSETEEQFAILNQYRNHKSMLVVWKFYCGLIGSNPNSSFQYQINLIFTSQYADTLYRIHCAFESQQAISCDAVLECADKCVLSFKGNMLNLADYNAMSHVISKASYSTLGLQFHSCALYSKSAAGKVITSCTNLQTLDISGNEIDSDGAVALAEGLKSCINLQILDISLNNITSVGATALVEGLKSFANLQQLVIGSNNIYSEGAAALAEGLKSCTNLQTLDISRNNIGSRDAAAPAEGLKSCTNLQKRSKSNESEGAAALAESLKSCTNLQTLDISRNNIGSRDAAALAESLESCTNLQTLNISQNNIGSEGAAALAESLESCTNLQTLNISRNNIGSEGAAALHKLTSYNSQLQLID